MLSIYPIFLSRKLPIVVGSLAGPYLAALLEGYTPFEYDIYTSSLLIICGIAHLGLSCYLSNRIVYSLDMMHLLMRNTIIILTLEVTSAAFILIFAN